MVTHVSTSFAKEATDIVCAVHWLAMKADLDIETKTITRGKKNNTALLLANGQSVDGTLKELI